jgi:two-component system response regulator HupR/HoxA
MDPGIGGAPLAGCPRLAQDIASTTMPSIATRPFEELHIVRQLRETIRKWWKIEIAFCDPEGYVADHAQGIVIPPHNDFCKASLGSKKGFAMCNHAVRDAIRECRATGDESVHIGTACHLGFPIIVKPIVFEGEFRGALFCGGFLIQEDAAEAMEAVAGRAAGHGFRVDDPDGAIEGIPILQRRDVEYFKDLLETTVAEILVFARTMKQKEEHIALLESALTERHQFGNIIGKARVMQRVFNLLERIADADTTVLITGENGTGKELVAQALHYNSSRKDKPFVEINCSALTDTLLESELFGHVKGAFTGAIRDKKGLVEVADGGTLFLDEVGDMSPTMQPKLLRFLQEGSFLPVGETGNRQSDVRVLAATNRDLPTMVEAGTFREDLYYRLNVIPVQMPPLRERSEDIPLLCEHFLEKLKFAGKSKGTPKRLQPEVLRDFYRREWHGNVRELESEIERLVVLSGDDEEIGPGLLDIEGGGRGPDLTSYRHRGSLEESVRALERDLIEAGLIQTHWNKSRLSRDLGISRTTLIKKIKEYGLEETP